MEDVPFGYNSIHEKAFDLFFKRFEDSIRDRLSLALLENATRFAFYLPSNLRDEINCKFEQTEGINILLSMRLSDFGSVQSFFLGTIPVPDKDGIFKIDNNEYCVIGQLIRSPGLYLEEKDEGSWEATFVPYRGLWVSLNCNKDEVVTIRIGRSKEGEFTWEEFCALVGINDDLIELTHPPKIDPSFVKKIGVKDGSLSVQEAIKHALFKQTFLSDLGRRQTNRVLKQIDNPPCSLPDSETLAPEDLLLASRLVRILHQKDRESFFIPDPRSLAFQRVKLIDEFLHERVTIPFVDFICENISRYIKNQRDRVNEDDLSSYIEKLVAGKIETLFKDAFRKKDDKNYRSPVRLITTDNNLDRKAISRRVTFALWGKGDIHVPDFWRDVHWSDYGRLCPIDTPQSELMGLTLSIPPEARINELGLIEVPLNPVVHENGKVKIENRIEYLSALDEEENPRWIAFFDERDKLIRGEKVFARKAGIYFDTVNASDVSFVDAFPTEPYSLPVRLIPFMQHDDATRCLMATSAMRQATNLVNPEPPLVQTGYEKLVSSDGVTPWAFGVNLLTAYMPYRGLNFEDAVVISESGAKKLVSFRMHEVEIYSPSEAEPARFTLASPLSCPRMHREKLDSTGLVKIGAKVFPGDIIAVFKILSGDENKTDKKDTEKSSFLASAFEKSGAPPVRFFRVPFGVSGTVERIEMFASKKDQLAPDTLVARIYIREELPLQVGDKISNRHGGKGVISRILPDNEMPFFIDDKGKTRHVDIILNPLGVLGRLNIGQLYELHAGWAIKEKGNGKPLVVGNKKGPEVLSELYGCSVESLGSISEGLFHLYLDRGKTLKTENPVAVGYTYIMKLGHLAVDKVQGRGFERIYRSPLHLQALRGKKLRGGQRIGEMEVWAIEAYDARHILEESLSLRSDDLEAAEWAWNFQLSLVKDINVSTHIPETLRSFALYLEGMGLKMEGRDVYGNRFKISRSTVSPREITELIISPISYDDITEPVFTVKKLKEIPSLGNLLFSPEFFPKEYPFDIEDRCYRPLMLRLPVPVVNVLFVDFLSDLLGVSRSDFIKHLTTGASINWKLEEDRKWFHRGLSGYEESHEKITHLERLHNFLEWLEEDERIHLKEHIETLKKVKKAVTSKRIKTLEKILDASVYLPSLMIKWFPIIPPHLRPTLEGHIDDFNRLYLNLLATLRKWDTEENDDRPENKRPGKTGAENIAIRIQKIVGAIIDDGWGGPPVRVGRRVIRESIMRRLSGKDGFIRKHLLGKRLDYSGRAVIIPDPSLGFTQCGIPYRLAVEMFYPELLGKLCQVWRGTPLHIIEQRIRQTLTHLSEKERRNDYDVLDISRELHLICSQTPVILNRQPTLHRLGVQSFYCRINLHDCISLHPLVTAGFNADFDGDTMAVHRVIGSEAKKEVLSLLPTENLFSPASGELTLNLSLDVALGAYLGTEKIPLSPKNPFRECEKYQKLPMDKERLRNCLSVLLKKASGQPTKQSNIINNLTDYVFETVTRKGVTLSIYEFFRYRNMLNRELNDVERQLDDLIARNNDNLSVILKSKARADIKVLRQIVARRGIFETIYRKGSKYDRVEIESNLLEGMPIAEAFSSCRGSRKTIMDKTMKTADAGYLMRRMIELTKDITVSEEDCGIAVFEDPSFVAIPVTAEMGSEEKIARYLLGRTLLRPYVFNGEEVSLVTSKEQALGIARSIISDKTSLWVRSPFFCRAKKGVCQKCYGIEMSTGSYPAIGSYIGITSAQSIGEPGTQLVLRTFHTGGIADRGGISSDLERVEELLRKDFAEDEELKEALENKDAVRLGKVILRFIDELFSIYCRYGAEISPKHFEVLLRGLCEIKDPSDLPRILKMNEKLAKTTNWLSSASFERTKKVITEAVLFKQVAGIETFKERIMLGFG